MDLHEVLLHLHGEVLGGEVLHVQEDGKLVPVGSDLEPKRSGGSPWAKAGEGTGCCGPCRASQSSQDGVAGSSVPSYQDRHCKSQCWPLLRHTQGTRDGGWVDTRLTARPGCKAVLSADVWLVAGPLASCSRAAAVGWPAGWLLVGWLVGWLGKVGCWLAGWVGGPSTWTKAAALASPDHHQQPGALSFPIDWPRPTAYKVAATCTQSTSGRCSSLRTCV